MCVCVCVRLCALQGNVTRVVTAREDHAQVCGGSSYVNCCVNECKIDPHPLHMRVGTMCVRGTRAPTHKP